MSPRRNWDSPSPSLASVCAGEKLSTLPTLWVGMGCVNFLGVVVRKGIYMKKAVQGEVCRGCRGQGG
jgi:hypothetical protein